MEQSAIEKVDGFASCVHIAGGFVLEVYDLDFDVGEAVSEVEVLDVVILAVVSLQSSGYYLVKLVVVVDQLEGGFPLLK